jgi:hypothetical protein
MNNWRRQFELLRIVADHGVSTRAYNQYPATANMTRRLKMLPEERVSGAAECAFGVGVSVVLVKIDPVPVVDGTARVVVEEVAFSMRRCGELPAVG